VELNVLPTLTGDLFLETVLERRALLSAGRRVRLQQGLEVTVLPNLLLLHRIHGFQGAESVVELDVLPTLTGDLFLETVLELRSLLSAGLLGFAENVTKLYVSSAIALNLIADALVGITARPEASRLDACDRQQGDSPHG